MHALQVNEQPGSYLWHDHSASNRADGLQGALIVLPPDADKNQFDKTDRVMFLTDWFHGEFFLLSMSVCNYLLLCPNVGNCSLQLSVTICYCVQMWATAPQVPADVSNCLQHQAFHLTSEPWSDLFLILAGLISVVQIPRQLQR